MSVEKLRPSFTFDEDRLDQLRAIVPEAFADGKINWDVLKEALGEHLEDEDAEAEHFGFFWPGKREARRLVSRPSRGTLVPQPGLGVDEDETHNIFIEGENLEVLKLLQKSCAGRIKMIYIDPPYNSGQDFIYPDDFAEPLESYLQRTEQADERGELLTSNPKASGRYHSDWLSMMLPRLRLARELLQEDGVIFISIDDNELHHLRMLMNELFGEENFIDCIIWKKRYGGGAKEKYLVTLHEYILFYAKNKNLLDRLFVPLDQESIDRYYTRKDDNYPVRGPYRTHPLEATRSVGYRENLVFPIPGPHGEEIWPERQWWWNRERVQDALEKGELEFVEGEDGWTVHTKQYLRDEQGNMRQTKPFSIIDDIFTQHGTAEIEDIFGDSRVFAFPKPSALVERLIEIAGPSENEIVLDFFAGSCPTAHAVFNYNRRERRNIRFLGIQIPEPVEPDSAASSAGFRSIADIGRERIRRVANRMKTETENQLDLHPDEDLGFKCYRLDRSHFKEWEDYEGEDPDRVATLFDQFESPLVEDWQPEDLLTEVLLIEGFPLDSRIELQDQFTRNQVQLVTSDFHQHRLFVCLDGTVAPETIAQLDLQDQDVFVCLDTALTDEAKVRLSDTGNLHVI